MSRLDRDAFPGVFSFYWKSKQVVPKLYGTCETWSHPHKNTHSFFPNSQLMPPSLPPPGPPPLPPFLFCLGPFFFLFLSLSLSFHAAFPRIFRRIKGVSLWIFFHRSMGQWQQSVIRISRLGFYACNVMIRHNRGWRKSSRKDRCKSRK